MLDRQKFDDNFRSIDKEVIISIINTFEVELPRRFDQIHENILEKDFRPLAFNIHSLKGIVGVFTAEVPLKLAQELEILANKNIAQDMIPIYEELKSASETLLIELIKIRKELSA